MSTDTAQHGLSAHSHGNVPERERAGARGGSAHHSFASFDVGDHVVPHGREEEWRFTPMKRLRGLHDGTIAGGGEVSVEVQAPEGVRLETVGRADARIGSSGYVPGDVISARAWSSFEKATVLTLPGDARADGLVTLSVRGQGSAAAAYGHTVVVAEPFAEGVVVLDHAGSGVVADNVEIVAGDGAKLTVVSVHDWDDDAVHVSYHHSRVGRDATVKHVAVNFGGDLVRVSASVDYAAPGGDAEMLGLYYCDSGQHQEHRLFVDHNQPSCRSNVLYKGALQGAKAHTVWIGDVLIRPEAEGISTFELNRNLVLTEGARADSVPNLEIETGEIEGAGHASAIGRFDDEQLFYLQARGIPEDEARRLVVRGFFAELINKIGVPEIAERLTDTVERELERSQN